MQYCTERDVHPPPQDPSFNLGIRHRILKDSVPRTRAAQRQSTNNAGPTSHHTRSPELSDVILRLRG